MEWKSVDVEAALLELFKNARLKNFPFSMKIYDRNFMWKGKTIRANDECYKLQIHRWLIILIERRKNYRLLQIIWWKTARVLGRCRVLTSKHFTRFVETMILLINKTILFYLALPYHTHMFKTEFSEGLEKIKQSET